MSSSPRPIAYRAFTVLLAFLLVGGVIAPVAASSPAAAQSDGSITIEEDCGAAAKFAFPRSCHAAEAVFPDIDTSSAQATQIDVHTGLQSVYEGEQQIDTIYQNYLQDTGTLASLEARNAIADAYENNEMAAVAQSNGQVAMSDYYSLHQKQSLEILSAESQEVAYYASAVSNQSGISDSFVSMSFQVDRGRINKMNLTGGTETHQFELVNGSTVEYQTPEFHVEGEGETGGYYYDISRTESLNLSDYNATTEEWSFSWETTGETTTPYLNWRTAGDLIVMNVPDADLPSQTVYSQQMPVDRLRTIRDQAQTVKNNYDDGAAEDLYSAMDSGQISPNDVRGAEGMVRYMSGADGDSNVTRDRFNLALRSTLDLSSADLGSTMVVDFEGATERSRNATSENVTFDYNHVNETYEGLLFSSETPDEGFETDVEYNVSNFNGTTTMVYDDGASEATFYRGNFTITEMYDEDGNTVDQADWSDPRYESYNATEFINAMEYAQEQRAEINSNDDGGSSGISIGDPFDGIGSGGAIVGLVIVIVAIAGVTVFVVRRP